jgi:hypothetical protein
MRGIEKDWEVGCLFTGRDGLVSFFRSMDLEDMRHESVPLRYPCNPIVSLGSSHLRSHLDASLSFHSHFQS